MANGNRYAAAMAPPAAGPPPDAGAPPPTTPPQGMPTDGAPPTAPPAAGPTPALTEAVQILRGHEGPIGDLLKDPSKLGHIRVVFDAVMQDPGAMQSLAKIGIGPEKLQQFGQMLQQAEQGGKTQAAPHWLAR